VNKVGKNIKSLRKKQNLTQVQLSELINVSSQVVSNWERGYSILSSDDLAKLIEVFGVPADKILGTDYLLIEGKIKGSSVEETEMERLKREIMDIVVKARNEEDIKSMLHIVKKALKE
jgi:transcriptional regulator with XRE-family HTH domain